MPAPVEDILVAPRTGTVSVALEPAANVFHSLLLLAKKNGVSGLDNWVAETILSMSSSERQRHRLVMIGLFFAAGPADSYASFPAYLDHLEATPPENLRDKIMDAYINLPCRDGEDAATGGEDDKETILASLENFLDFLGQRFSSEDIELGLESKAYTYIVDPPAMKQLIVSHLRHMWDAFLAEEWARVEPMLMDSVAAFNQVDFSRMDKLEAAEFITGRSLSGGHLEKMIDKAERLVFVPSAHVGPYLGKVMIGDALGVVFGARLPEGSQYYAPDLSRAEILVRLAALADDTRLRILKLVAEEGEMRSQAIMRRLDLSQSAASRHLKQLSASGYLVERRCEGAKCYEINQQRVEATLEAVSGFILS